MTKKTLIVNLYGAPGAGKSTGMAYIFSKLKMAGVNAEMAPEFAKEKVWEESKAVFKNQIYIFGKQYFALTRLLGKVDVIVTDAPLLASKYYIDNTEPGAEAFKKMVSEINNTLEQINVIVKRVKPYNPAGRFQTEEGSDAIAHEIKAMVDGELKEVWTIPGENDGYDVIIRQIHAHLNRMQKEEEEKSNANDQ